MDNTIKHYKPTFKEATISSAFDNSASLCYYIQYKMTSIKDSILYPKHYNVTF